MNTLGASKFRGWDKNEWLAKQRKAIGMKADKQQKVPYRIMKGIQRKQTEKKKRYEEQARAADVVLGKKKQKKKGGRFAIKGGPKRSAITILGSLNFSYTLYCFHSLSYASLLLGFSTWTPPVIQIVLKAFVAQFELRKVSAY